MGEDPSLNPTEEIVSIDKSGRVRPEREGGALCRALELQEKMLEELREILADLEIALRPALRPKQEPGPAAPSTVSEITTSEMTRLVEQNNHTIQAAALDAAGLLDHLDI